MVVSSANLRIKVVLAASICTRGGKTIVTRQFRDLPKDRVTALLAGFPKLISEGTQHTTAEDNDVRYVYQPIDELYLVLITNLQSNILQDIGTLNLLGQLVGTLVRQADEREVLEKSFEIMFAFDEAVNMGYRENLTVAQVTKYLEMESHEENLHEIIERNKEMEAAEERKLKAKQLEMSRREMAKRSAGMGGASGGFGSQRGSMGTSSFGSAARTAPPASMPETIYDRDDDAKPKAKPAIMRGKGLQLGKKKTNLRSSLDNDPEVSLLMESHAQARAPPTSANATKNNSYTAHSLLSSKSAAPAEVHNDGIHIAIKEELAVVMERMGAVKSVEVKGSLQLRIADPDLAAIHLQVHAEGPANQYRTHPNVDKSAFMKDKVIKLKDASRGFPTNNQQLSVLRWQISQLDAARVPLQVQCWFVAAEDGSGHLSGIVEYELNESCTETLENVKVKIPLMTGDVAVSSLPEQTSYNQYDDGLEWVIPEIVPGSESAAGSFEWVAEASSEDDFFPMAVEFGVREPSASFGGVEIVDVVSAADEPESVEFEKEMSIHSESFAIV